jgi:hypothetical protein
VNEQARKRIDGLRASIADAKQYGLLFVEWDSNSTTWVLDELECALVVVDAAIAWHDYEIHPNDTDLRAGPSPNCSLLLAVGDYKERA